MNHQGTAVLETERLILRPFAMEDAQAMYRNWASDPRVSEFLTWPAHASPKVSEEVLKEWTSRYDQPDFYTWAIELKDLKEVIGSISVVRTAEKTQSAEIGYCIGTDWWGSAIVPEAGKAVIRYLFEEAGFQRICARHDGNNPKSGRVMQKLGMRFEGVLRKAGFNNRGICDEVCYSILKEEYASQKPDLPSLQKAQSS